MNSPEAWAVNVPPEEVTMEDVEMEPPPPGEEEAKEAAEFAGPYIPGMSGTVRPEEQIVATGNINDLKEEEKFREAQEAVRRQRDQMDALAKLQEDQKLKLEREEMIRIQQEKLSKLAPWAKKVSDRHSNSNI